MALLPNQFYENISQDDKTIIAASKNLENIKERTAIERSSSIMGDFIPSIRKEKALQV
ncbi:MAG TPA: hypothetical protein VN414_07170 [Methanosarcina sp.]|nr:hypothetical protein [Methanosarcina sp.]